MRRRIEILGASGQSYAFTRLAEEDLQRRIGVNYVIAVPLEAGGWRVLHVGGTNDLSDQAWQPLLDAARAQDSAAECLIRLNVSRIKREAEAIDIAERHLGRAEPPSG